MGTRGPVPKRSTERAGHRAKDDRPDRVMRSSMVRPPVESKDWKTPAKRWYRSLTRSGQALYFEPSDWEYAHLTAWLLSNELAKPAPSAEMMKTILTAMDRLGTTEGARRRMGIEIEHGATTAAAPTTDGDKVVVMEQFRRLEHG